MGQTIRNLLDYMYSIRAPAVPGQRRVCARGRGMYMHEHTCTPAGTHIKHLTKLLQQLCGENETLTDPLK